MSQQQVRRKSSSPGNHHHHQSLTALLGGLMPFQRSGKSHSTSCVTAAQSQSSSAASASSKQQQQQGQLQLPATPPRVLVSSTDEAGARQATFHFPSGVCQDSDSEEDEINEDDEENEDAEDNVNDDLDVEHCDEALGACCVGGGSVGDGGSMSAASLTVSGGRSRTGGRPDIQRCHSDSGTEATPAHALFLRHRTKSQKTQDDGDIGGVYDGDDPACQHQQRRQQQQQQQQQHQHQHNQQHHLHQHQHQHHRIRLGFGGRSAEQKDKPKKKSLGDKFSFLSRKSVDTQSTDKASGIKPSGDQVQRWGASFDSLLNDKYGLALFRAFLKTEYSDENIEFWIACEEYRTLTGPKKQTLKAQKIYNEFVAFQAPREVNLDSTTRLATINAMGSPDGHLFEQAQKRIQALMEKDSYQRFLRSEVYQNHLKDSAKTNNSGSASASSIGGH